MAKIDPAYGNSSGYFRDPSNGEELSVDTPRVIPCSFENGKFVWPQVSFANGDMGKIVYACFTPEEKELYKAYRGRGNGNVRQRSNTNRSTAHSDDSSNSTSERYTTLADGKVIDNQTGEFVDSPEDSVISASNQAIVDRCDKFIGVSQIAGITYAVLTEYGSNKLYHIPRSTIKDEDIRRLCDGCA